MLLSPADPAAAAVRHQQRVAGSGAERAGRDGAAAVVGRQGAAEGRRAAVKLCGGFAAPGRELQEDRRRNCAAAGAAGGKAVRQNETMNVAMDIMLFYAR